LTRLGYEADGTVNLRMPLESSHEHVEDCFTKVSEPDEAGSGHQFQFQIRRWGNGYDNLMVRHSSTMAAGRLARHGTAVQPDLSMQTKETVTCGGCPSPGIVCLIGKTSLNGLQLNAASRCSFRSEPNADHFSFRCARLLVSATRLSNKFRKHSRPGCATYGLVNSETFFLATRDAVFEI
jgi:hypothetical protein